MLLAIAGAINAVEMALVKLNQIYLALFAQYQLGNALGPQDQTRLNV
jgi:hypothetical protein